MYHFTIKYEHLSNLKKWDFSCGNKIQVVYQTFQISQQNQFEHLVEHCPGGSPLYMFFLLFQNDLTMTFNKSIIRGLPEFD